MPVKQGDRIKVDYVGTLEDGFEFDNSEKHGAPLEFTVGEGEVIKGFDEAIIGMEIGEEKTINLKPSEAYGEADPHLVIKVPKDKLPTDMKLEKGMMLGVSLPTGQQMPATIVDIAETEVTIDFNPPLAGKTLNFKLKIIEIMV